jgi:glycine/D-amino acid oxidase-like deaminating enzyme
VRRTSNNLDSKQKTKMAPRVDSIPQTSVLPVKVDVVVIGGGIIGASAALFLAERGVSVALCEKGRIAGEQSSRNWGWCRKMGRDPAEIPLAVESLRLWEGIAARTGTDVGFRQSGILYLCEDWKEAAKHEEWLAHAQAFQIDSRLIGPKEIERLLPGSARRWPASLYTPTDGYAEPEKATSAIAASALRHGAAVLEHCAVRGIETKAGRVSGVVTEKGPIACSQVILAGGAWTRLFCGNLGIRFPQLKVLGSVMRTGPIEGGPEHAVGAGNFAFRKRLDGGYTIAQRNANIAEIIPDSFALFFDFAPALIKQWHELRLRVGRRFVEEWRMPRRWALDDVTPFETIRTLDPAPSNAVLEEGRRNLIESFPAFRDMKIVERWAGIIDVTPDGVPVISEVPSLPGFFLASGFSGHGFGIGPGAGHLIADLATGKTPIVDPRPFRYERLRASRKAP